MSLDTILSFGLEPWEIRLERRFLDDLEGAPDAGGVEDAGSWLPALHGRVLDDLDHLLRSTRDWDAYMQRYRRSVTPAERREHILAMARRLGSEGRELARDRAAFGRWFGHDALTARYRRRQGEILRRLGFHLGRIGALAAFALERLQEPAAQASAWRRWQLAELLPRVLVRRLDPRTDRLVLDAAARITAAVHPELRAELLPADLLGTARRLGGDLDENAWVRVAALELLATVAPAEIEALVLGRLRERGSGDDLFVRARMLELARRHLAMLGSVAQILRAAEEDPSPFVRQALARLARTAAPGAGERTWFRLALEDPVPEVRRSALLLAAEGSGEGREPARRLLAQSLLREQDPTTLRFALEAVERGQQGAVCEDEAAARRWVAELLPVVRELKAGSGSVPVRRWAAETLNRMWVVERPTLRSLAVTLSEQVGRIGPGDDLRLPADLRRAAGDEESLGRVMAALASRDFGLYLDPGTRRDRLVRGERYAFRLWRLLHEIGRPAPDKRQGHPHTRGRVHYGRLAAPSGSLAELTETGVPGEPVFLAEEQGCRPFLPLLDDVLSTTNQWGRVAASRFFTSEGVTRVAPPRGAAARIAAWARLSARFPYLAGLRNWREREGGDPATYVAELRRLGFEVRFEPWSGEAADPTVARFFPAALPLPAMGDLLPRFQEYFLSLYGNSLSELALVTAVGTGLFLGRQVARTRRVRRSRGRIPLVVGGWGTRGKSSVERLKAALFSGLGYATFCKTTGCEAMFLDAPTYGELAELPLFRSYDKATIWEQADVVEMAAGLGADVFLWECMGLNPRYVRILQRDWMRDDLATLTNAYPDHEDIQGPAGVDIPWVMGEFVPVGSRLLTAEDGMLPILRESGRRAGTEVLAVGWLESASLAPDLLDRFPYQEHPANVALVAALAAELGIPGDLAVATMADRVVPDLGVLKTYPEARVRGRTLLFSNGMSANERHAALGNWRRLGLDRAEPTAGEWVTTVVNNRADRIPRSKVFARVVVEDLSADRYFLIGTNLEGLQSNIGEAWKELEERIGSSDGRDLGEEAVFWARRFRRPTSDDEVRSRLVSMLHGVGCARVETALASWRDPATLAGALEQAGVSPGDSSDVLGHHRSHLATVSAIRGLEARSSSGDRPGRVAELRRLVRGWLQESLVVIEDPHATGDEIIDRIARETPPGTRNHVVGIQNIKGTGLDFVYRWVAWDRCRRNLDALEGPDPVEAERALRDLAATTDFGLLSEEAVRSVVDRVRRSPRAQRESLQAQLEVVRGNLERTLAEVRRQLGQGSTAGGRAGRALAVLEKLLDAGDAVRRRRRADRVYRDLVAERVSHARAAEELHRIDRRQKGGWVWRQLRGMMTTVAAPEEEAPRHEPFPGLAH